MELSHQPCPFCGSSDGFSYSTDTGLFRCFVCEETPKTKRGLCLDGKTLTPFRGNQEDDGEISLEPYSRHYRGIKSNIFDQFGVIS